MSKKSWMLLALVVLLGGISVYLNKDWFSRDDIQIIHQSRPPRARSARHTVDSGPESAINPITFGIDRKLKLTCLKVIPLSAIETNKYPQPIWHLVSESNSV